MTQQALYDFTPEREQELKRVIVRGKYTRFSTNTVTMLLHEIDKLRNDVAVAKGHSERAHAAKHIFYKHLRNFGATCTAHERHAKKKIPIKTVRLLVNAAIHDVFDKLGETL